MSRGREVSSNVRLGKYCTFFITFVESRYSNDEINHIFREHWILFRLIRNKLYVYDSLTPMDKTKLPKETEGIRRYWMIHTDQ